MGSSPVLAATQNFVRKQKSSSENSNFCQRTGCGNSIAYATKPKFLDRKKNMALGSQNFYFVGRFLKLFGFSPELPLQTWVFGFKRSYRLGDSLLHKRLRSIFLLNKSYDSRKCQLTDLESSRLYRPRPAFSKKLRNSESRAFELWLFFFGVFEFYLKTTLSNLR